MKRTAVLLLALAVLHCGATGVNAQTPNVLLSSPDDLATLTVGDVVTIDVNLQGLAVNSNFIFNMDTSVLFPSTNFEIIPDTTNTSGLTTGTGSPYVFLYSGQVTAFDSTSLLSAGDAVGNFNNSATAPAISENGIYYSFMLKAIATGSGSIQFDSTPGANQYAADNTDYNYAPLPTGSPLGFTISAVPEPSSLVLGIMATAAGVGVAWHRRRRFTASAARGGR